MHSARFLRVAAVVAALAIPAAAADPSLLGVASNLAMPDATTVAGVRVANVLTSPFGRFLLSQMMMRGYDFSSFVQATGFDPTHNLQQVVLASDYQQNGGSAIIFAAGQFDTATIMAKALTAGATSRTYKDVTIISAPTMGHSGHTFAAAFLSNTLALAGDFDAITAAIDRRGSTSSIGTALAKKASDLSAANDAWFVTTAPLAALAANANPLIAATLQPITQIAGGVTFGTTVQLAGEALTKTGKDAQMLAQLLQLLVGLVQTNGGNQPGVAQIAALLKNLQVTAVDNTLKLSLSVPEADIEALFQMLHAGAGRHMHGREHR